MTTNPAVPVSPAKPRPRKGLRPKHVPQRMCVVCRDRAAKRTLTRVVRTTEGVVEVDPSGKKNGRGAYLCDKAACWERAVETGTLGRALKTTIDTSAAENLRRHAASLVDPAQPRSGAIIVVREEANR